MLVTICEIILEKLLADANLFFEQVQTLAVAADALGCLIDGVTALQNCFFLLNKFFKFNKRNRIQTSGRLVEDDQWAIEHECEQQVYLLFCSTGKGTKFFIQKWF